MKCDVNCIYFPQVETVLKEEVADNIKYRNVIRRCGYDARKIKSWDECHREDGPFILK